MIRYQGALYRLAIDPRKAIIDNLKALAEDILKAVGTLDRSIGTLADWIVKNPEALNDAEEGALNKYTKQLEEALDEMKGVAEIYEDAAEQADRPKAASRSRKHDMTRTPRRITYRGAEYVRVGAKERTITVYDIEELEGKARERARDWVREGMFWIEDSVTEHLAEELRQDGWKVEPGGVHWGLYDQGSGASFEADVPEGLITQHAGPTLTKLVNGGVLVLSARTVKTSDRYPHSGTMDVEVDEDVDETAKVESEEYRREIDALHDALLDEAREYADKLYRLAEDAYEAEMSDEAVDEHAMANEYEFLESGRRAP